MFNVLDLEEGILVDQKPTNSLWGKPNKYCALFFSTKKTAH